MSRRWMGSHPTLRENPLKIPFHFIPFQNSELYPGHRAIVLIKDLVPNYILLIYLTNEP